MTMNQAAIDDLKQFIDTTIVRRVTDILDEKLDQKFETKLAPIHLKIDDLTTFVLDTLDKTNNLYDAQFKNHERRIVKLETNSTG
jgi:hypothetical protein